MHDRWPKIRDFVTSRWFVKGAFLAFFLFSVVQLLRFERWARGEGPYVARPEAVAGILPIGHFTSFFAWLRGGGWDTVLPAGLVIILGALALSLFFKRGFCGWICPVGTIWEAFAALGRRLMGGRNIRVPRWLDLIGRGFRYLLAAMFMFALLTVPLQAAVEFRSLPYMYVADLKILHLMADPIWLVVAALAAALSVLFGPVWCRYLCPLGGLYSAVGVASPCTIERDTESCIHCKRCSKVCHAFVEPEKTKRVWAPECDGCMDCVKVCPVDDCLEAKAFSRVRVAPWVWPVIVVALWLTIWGFARLSGNWTTSLSPDVFKQVIQSGMLEQRTRGFFE
ncbi:MAG: 4Fe-4S binding protein [Actinobacteria bacterium]|nr:MAG: 4Fe-4S binding protein [Actinomycetota bacterium]